MTFERRSKDTEWQWYQIVLRCKRVREMQITEFIISICMHFIFTLIAICKIDSCISKNTRARL